MENFIFSVFLLSLIVLMFSLKRGSKELLRASFLIYLFGILTLFGVAIFKVIYQYLLWKNHPVSKFLLPPHQSFDYFFSYSFFHFLKVPLYNFFSSIFLLALLKIFNKIFNKRLFFEEEIFFAGFAMLVVEFPINLFLLAAVIILGILISLIKKILKKESQYTSLYYLWLPLTILSIIFKNLIISLPIIKNLIF